MAKNLALIFFISFSSLAVAKNKVVALVSDYGNGSPLVSMCKGAMLSKARSLEIIDVYHSIAPYSRDEAAGVLAENAPHFPQDTVFVAIVDPAGEGKTRPIAVRTKKGQVFVVPDNGLLTLIADRDGVAEAREISKDHFPSQAEGPVAYGRDIYCPVAAQIASGKPLSQLGREVTDLKKLITNKIEETADKTSGNVQFVDSVFGNVTTNIPAAHLNRLGYKRKDRIRVIVGEAPAMTFTWVKEFSEVPPAEALLYVTSENKIALGMNRRNFGAEYGVRPFHKVTIERMAPDRNITSDRKGQ